MSRPKLKSVKNNPYICKLILTIKSQEELEGKQRGAKKKKKKRQMKGVGIKRKRRRQRKKQRKEKR